MNRYESSTRLPKEWHSLTTSAQQWKICFPSFSLIESIRHTISDARSERRFTIALLLPTSGHHHVAGCCSGSFFEILPKDVMNRYASSTRLPKEWHSLTTSAQRWKICFPSFSLIESIRHTISDARSERRFTIALLLPTSGHHHVAGCCSGSSFEILPKDVIVACKAVIQYSVSVCIHLTVVVQVRSHWRVPSWLSRNRIS